MKVKQLEAIQLLVSGLPQSEVARRVGVSDRTLRNWLKQEEFQKELNQQLKEKIKNELFKRLFSQEEQEKKKRRVAELIDEAINNLDLSKPYAVKVLIKWYKVLNDADNKRAELLLELHKKDTDNKKDLEGIRIVIENARNGQNDNP